MGVGYQKFQAGSPDGYLDFGVISTTDVHAYVHTSVRTYVCTYVHSYILAYNLSVASHKNNA